LTTSSTAAELYYSKQAGFALLPFVVVLVSFIVWYVFGMLKGIPFFKKRPEVGKGVPPISTPKDKFIVTVSAVLYLLFPTLVSRTFQMFSCSPVGNDSYFRVDMEESCNSYRYKVMVGLLGISQLIIYVIGLPLLMLWFLIRNKGRLNTFVVQCRYGVYFAGYKVRDKLSVQSFFKSSLHLFQKDKETKSILYFFFEQKYKDR
jgi:hypothetical protein